MDILDIFVESVFDMALARGNVGVWLKKRFVSFLLAVGSFVFLVMLFSAIRSASVLKIIEGAIGTVIFVILDFRYTFWWLREGRFGMDCPLIDKIPLPKGDLMNTPPEDAPFGTKPKEDIWEQIGARE
jgi:hypothetical protein